jgi:hypothetical protein
LDIVAAPASRTLTVTVIVVGLALLLYEPVRDWITQKEALTQKLDSQGEREKWLAAAAVVVVALVAFALWGLFRHRAQSTSADLAPKSNITAQPAGSTSNGVQPSTTRKKKGSKPKLPAMPTVSTTGDNSPAVGSVSQGPGSIAQIGGTGNTASITNVKATKRTLTEKQKQGFREMLAWLPEGIRISISCVGNEDASQYGYQFFELMTEDHGMGWSTSAIPAKPETDKGLWFQVNEADEALAKEIVRRLRGAGLNVDERLGIKNSQKPGQLQFVIGLADE